MTFLHFENRNSLKQIPLTEMLSRHAFHRNSLSTIDSTYLNNTSKASKDKESGEKDRLEINFHKGTTKTTPKFNVFLFYKSIHTR